MQRAAPTSANTSSCSDTTARLNTGLVVLVEDDTDLADALMWWFELQGHKAVHFTSAESLMDQCRPGDKGLNMPYPPGTGQCEPIACAVVDMNLPGASGIELIRILRATSPSLSSVLITAMHATDRARHGTLPHGVPCLTKPFELADLERVIQGGHMQAALQGRGWGGITPAHPHAGH
jgi:FixJ family two-component response regulator